MGVPIKMPDVFRKSGSVPFSLLRIVLTAGGPAKAQLITERLALRAGDQEPFGGIICDSRGGYPRACLLNHSTVRPHARSAAALLYRSGVASQWNP